MEKNIDEIHFINSPNNSVIPPTLKTFDFKIDDEVFHDWQEWKVGDRKNHLKKLKEMDFLKKQASNEFDQFFEEKELKKMLDNDDIQQFDSNNCKRRIY